MEPITMMVVGREDSVSKNTVALTPDGVPDLFIKVMSPLANVAVRAARQFLQTLLGLLMAGVTGMATNTLPAGDFLHLLRVCAGLSVASTVICIIQNVIELLAKIDQTQPKLRG